jgi:membrane protease YdiL (CAAX protease family)
MVFVDKIAAEQVKAIGEMLEMMPKDMQKMMADIYTVETMSSSIMVTAIATLVIGAILLWLFARDRVSVKKGLAIGLLITTLVLGLNDIVLVLSAISLVFVATTPKSEKKKEKKEIKKLRELKITGKDRLWVVVLVLAYATQFIIPSFINSRTAAIIFDVLFNLLIFSLVLYVFRKRLSRDLKAFKENFGSYIGYVFKWWGLMLLMSLGAAIVRLVLGGEVETANQAALNSMPIWYVGPLAIIWAPFVEEGIFRGGLRRFVKNDKLFIVLSAILFGLLHTIGTETGIYNMFVQSLQYMVMGGVMAYTYSKTNNIFVNMGIHCVQNTLGVILMLFM